MTKNATYCDKHVTHGSVFFCSVGAAVDELACWILRVLSSLNAWYGLYASLRVVAINLVKFCWQNFVTQIFSENCTWIWWIYLEGAPWGGGPRRHCLVVTQCVGLMLNQVQVQYGMPLSNHVYGRVTISWRVQVLKKNLGNIYTTRAWSLHWR